MTPIFFPLLPFLNVKLLSVFGLDRWFYFFLFLLAFSFLLPSSRAVIWNSGFLSSLAFRFEQATPSESAGVVYKTVFVTIVKEPFVYTTALSLGVACRAL